MSSPRHKYVASRAATAPALRRMGPRKWAYHPPVTPHRSAFILVRRLMFGVLVAATLVLLGVLALKMYVDGQTQLLIYSPDSSKLPHRHVAIVFGAGLNTAGGPSKMLYDRVQAAAKLYKDGRVDKLLMTGDNSDVNYNEVEAMRRTAADFGVDDSDMILDYAGFSTWDSCYRARDVFSLKEAVLVTQRFHLPRALFTCNSLGVNVIGVEADTPTYPTMQNELRELPALVATVYNQLTNRQPRFLGPTIDVDEPQVR